MITCKICKRHFKRLTASHVRTHGISYRQYHEQFLQSQESQTTEDESEGLFISMWLAVASPLVAILALPLIILIAIINYVVIVLFWKENFQFLEFVWDMTWRFFLCVILTGLCFGIFGFLSELLIYLAHQFNRRTSTYFFKLYPTKAGHVQYELDKKSRSCHSVFMISP